MEQEPDRRWILLAVFALIAAGIVAAILISRSGGDDSAEEAASCATPPGPTATKAKKTKPKVEVPDCTEPKALVANELEKGTGAVAKSGDEVSVQYVGVGFETGEEFDASWDRGEPFSFTLGASAVIPGWDQGVEGMKVGGRRELIIPPDLAYGAAGSPPSIGPNETLVFVIDLLKVN
jgi:peptidylprolyl isomerase